MPTKAVIPALQDSEAVKNYHLKTKRHLYKLLLDVAGIVN